VALAAPAVGGARPPVAVAVALVAPPGVAPPPPPTEGRRAAPATPRAARGAAHPTNRLYRRAAAGTRVERAKRRGAPAAAAKRAAVAAAPAQRGPHPPPRSCDGSVAPRGDCVATPRPPLAGGASTALAACDAFLRPPRPSCMPASTGRRPQRRGLSGASAGERQRPPRGRPLCAPRQTITTGNNTTKITRWSRLGYTRGARSTHMRGFERHATVDMARAGGAQPQSADAGRRQGQRTAALGGTLQRTALDGASAGGAGGGRPDGRRGQVDLCGAVG